MDVGFAFARARLVKLTLDGSLQAVSEDAYGFAIAGLPGAGTSGRAGLASVQVRELAGRDDSAGLAIRWEVTGPDGGPFPVLDADIKLTPASDRTSVLTLAGVYRPAAPSGEAPDNAILRRGASAAIRNFLGGIAAGITGQPGPTATGAGPSPVPRPRLLP